MDISQKNISEFFDELLIDLNCQEDTKSYIVGIYKKYRTAEFDFSQDSITFMFSQARNNNNFLSYQNLGDWLFYTKSLFPDFQKNASEEYYNTIAQLSYYNCYKIIRSWRLYEELADQYIVLTENIRSKINYK